jgi:hypothetical protein
MGRKRFYGGLLALAFAGAHAETVVLRQDFESFDPAIVGVAGVDTDEGGSWREFRKTETAPQISDQEFHSETSASTGKSVRITRDNSITTDFWLIGTWGTTLDTGRVRISFRVLRDSADSGFSVHFGNAEKNAGVNTIAAVIGNRQSGEVLKAMNAEGAWQDAGAGPEVGSWARISFDIDFSAMTYSVSLNDVVAAENIPFKMNGPLLKIAFLPAAPDGNISFIDDVEVVALD